MIGLFKDIVNRKTQEFGAHQNVMEPVMARKLWLWLAVTFFLLLVLMFLPWTQNVEAVGRLSTLSPEDRPQEIHTVIAGRVDKWFVKEGDFVHAGDTIVELSEIKTDYFDPELIGRTDLQLKAKQSAIEAYTAKITALESQIHALRSNLPLKINQLNNKVSQNRLKVRTDSIATVAADTALIVAQLQLRRAQDLYKEGIKPKTEVEDKLNKYQEAEAKLTKAKNDLMISRAELTNSMIELNSVVNDFNEKISKAQSDKASAESMLYAAEADVAKMMNLFSNYSIRSGFYFVTAPQSGYIVKIQKAGIGETLKENDIIATIVPDNPVLAVELYINPMDMPLMRLGKKVRIIFDGWPAFVFSGWPNASFGTFGGVVAAIDRDISMNGKYRLLVKPDANEQHWPDLIRVGQGARGILLLNDVPIWKELWRQMNGFPPEFYQPEDNSKDKATKK
jgi:multidrug resistance efflux pump